MQTHTQTCCYGANAWTILNSIEQSIKRKVESLGTPLKDWDVEIYRGVLTGFNDAFIIDTAKRDAILNACSDEDERIRTAEIIRPILRGRDIKRYGYNWPGLWIINTHNGYGEHERIDINLYPALKQHLDNYLDKLSTRSDKGGTPYNLRNCVYLDLLSQPKIIWGEISDKSKFCIDVNGEYAPEATSFMLSGDRLLYLLAFLNCSLSEYIFSTIGTTTGVGTVRWKKYKILELPVPKSIPEELETALVEICSTIVKEKSDGLTSTVKLESDLNTMIFKIYGLSEEEISYLQNLQNR